MPDPGRIVVIENAGFSTLDRFTEWLGEDRVNVVRPHAGDPVPAAAPDGLIVLGGPISATDDDAAPWLPATRDLLARAVDDGTPALGICLGAQLLAVACGGEMENWAAAGWEVGVVDVRWRPESASDPLTRGLPDPYPAPSLHRDAVARLPDGATWLASSAMYPHQAFRMGHAAWGLQFHPEISLAAYELRAVRFPDVVTAAVVEGYRRRQADVAAAGREVARRFAAVCAPPIE
jgi:GMP synthase (glutamine-hydrolysing)